MNSESITPYSKSYLNRLSKTLTNRSKNEMIQSLDILTNRCNNSLRTNTSISDNRCYIAKGFCKQELKKVKRRSYSEDSIRLNRNDQLIINKYQNEINNLSIRYKSPNRLTNKSIPWLATTSNSSNKESISQIESSHRLVKIKSSNDLMKVYNNIAWRRCPWPTIDPKIVIRDHKNNILSFNEILDQADSQRDSRLDSNLDKKIGSKLDKKIDNQMNKSFDSLSMLSGTTFNRSINLNKSNILIKSNNQSIRHLILKTTLITCPTSYQSGNLNNYPSDELANESLNKSNRKIVRHTMVILRIPITRDELIVSINKQLGLTRHGGLSDLVIKQLNRQKKIVSKVDSKLDSTLVSQISKQLDSSIKRWLDNNSVKKSDTKIDSKLNSEIEISIRSLAMNTIEDSPQLSDDCELIIYIGGSNITTDLSIHSSTDLTTQLTNTLTKHLSTQQSIQSSIDLSIALSKSKHFFSLPKSNSLLGVNVNSSDDYEYNGYASGNFMGSDIDIQSLNYSVDSKIDNQLTKKKDSKLDNQVDSKIDSYSDRLSINRIEVLTEFIPVSNYLTTPSTNKLTNSGVVRRIDIDLNDESPLDNDNNKTDNMLDPIEILDNKIDTVKSSNNNFDYELESSKIDSQLVRDKDNNIDSKLEGQIDTKINSRSISNKNWARQVQLDLTDLLEDF